MKVPARTAPGRRISVALSTDGKPTLELRFPYDASLVTTVKTVPGRRWNPKEKMWTIPVGYLRQLQQVCAKRDVKIFMAKEVAEAIKRGQQDRRDMLTLRQAADAPLELITDTEPFGFQRAGINFLMTALKKFKGVLLADDMGCGKTFQALSILHLSPRLEQVLVLVPSTLKWNWAAEIEKHYPEMTYTVVDGSASKRAEQWAEPTRIKIANYELLLRDDVISVLQWDLVIADEATRLKNNRAKTTKKAKKLNRRYSLALTGTPIENTLDELHSIMDFCIEGILGTWWEFMNAYAKKDFWGGVVGWKGVDIIRDRIGPHFLRRTKAEVLTDLPPKIYSDMPVQLSPGEWAIYESIVKQIRDEIENNPRMRVANVLTECLRLLQCTSDYRVLLEDDGMKDTLDYPTKLRVLQEIVDAAAGRKVVAFSHFAEIVKSYAAVLGCPILTGDTKTKDRIALIDKFQKDDSRLLIMTEAGAYGINLTAADIVVHISEPWNPAKLRQREDRLHRLGQTSSVQVISLLANHSIDHRVRRIIHGKKELAESVLQEGGSDLEMAPKLTMHDMEELLGGE